MVSSQMLRCVALVRTDDSVVASSTVIRVTRIGELGTDAGCEEIPRYWYSYHPDEGSGRFLRNVGSYKSHTA
jgi:hypothetical protein